MIKIVGYALHELYERAEKDYKKLQLNAKVEDYYLSYFMAQQCIEKCFKVLLGSKDVDFPKIHDLEKLNQIVRTVWNDDESVMGFLSKYGLVFSALTSLYQNERYGIGIEDDYDAEHVDELIVICGEVLEITKTVI